MERKFIFIMFIYSITLYVILVALFAVLDAIEYTSFNKTDLAWLIGSISAAFAGIWRILYKLWRDNKKKNKEVKDEKN